MNGFLFFMTLLIILLSVWVLGFLFSYLMLLTEIKSEGETVTVGDRALMIVLSLLSFIMVFYIFIKAWVVQINRTGYWSKPLKEKEETKA